LFISAIEIEIDNLSNPRVVSFLEEHLQHMIEVTPSGCVHALDIESLKKPEITLWVVWEGGEVLCCGAVKKLDRANVELKSMRTKPTHLGQGVASHLLNHIIREVGKLKFEKIYLETGSYEAFLPARRLYEKFGFEYCGPFADYSENSNSVYMVKKI
jgi:putative acetyltransferase